MLPWREKPVSRLPLRPCIISIAKPDIADFFFRCRIEKVQPFIAVWHHKFTVDIDVFN